MTATFFNINWIMGVLILIFIIIGLCVLLVSEIAYVNELKQQLKDTKRELKYLQDKILDAYDKLFKVEK